MGDKNDSVKSILINIVSSIIFQIILMVFSASGISYVLLNRLNDLQNSVLTISYLQLIILCICIIIFMLTALMFIYSVHKKIKDRRIADGEECADDFYFTYYEKNLTIFKNGHGIIKHKFSIVVNDESKLQQIKKRLNISDGVKTSSFPSLEEMKKAKKERRFSDFGFWYKSDNGIISGVEEYYWDNLTPDREDKDARDNPQDLRWMFLIDKNRLEKGKPYEISYVISVPGLVALENGCLNKNLQKDVSEDRSFSSMKISHNTKNFKYIVSFEDGVCIDVPPKCEIITETKNGMKLLDISGDIDYDLLYTKYVFDVLEPEFGSNIRISWKYKVL